MTGIADLKIWSRAGLVAGLVFFVLAAALAQMPTATVLGVVKDTSGASVPDATLMARNIDTGQTRTTSTSADGSYRFSALPVGSYEIKVEHTGFQSSIRSGITLTVAQEAVVNVTLEVGAVEQTVAVTAEAPLVNTTTGSLGGLVDAERITDLPLNGRNFIGLTLMQAGISEHKAGPVSIHNVGNWFSSNGAPLRSNNMLLDGAIMQDMNGASSASLSGQTLGIEGIREYRVITNNFSAEYGMTMGSQTVMVSKSGTNQWHGSAFEFYRSSAMNARQFFDYKSIASQRRLPHFNRNNFGGSFGGPMRKDKTFFYVVLEEVRQRVGITNIQNGIPLSARVDGGLVPQIAPIIKPLLALFPVPNLPNNQFTLSAAQPTSDNWGQTRVDQNISSTDSLFVRYTIQDETQSTPQVSTYPGTTMENVTVLGGSRNQYATVSENHIFSPILLSTARLSFSRTGNWNRSQFPSSLVSPLYTLIPGPNNANPVGTINPGNGISPIGVPTDAFDGPQTLWSLSDDVFYTRGRHSLKFGTLMNLYRQSFQLGVGQYGSIGFADLTRFLLGQPNSMSGDITGKLQVRDYSYKTFGFYAQDDLRATQTFTLNLGLRYEFNTVPHERYGKNNSLRDIFHDVTMTPGPIMQNPSLLNFSPRFGFAWDVTGDGKTAVRGGFNLLYDIAALGSALIQDATGKPPFNQQSNVPNPPALTSLPLKLPAENIGRYQRPIDYHYGQPHNLQFNLAVERQLPFDMALTVAYSNARGLNLQQISEGNPTVPGGIPVAGACVPRPAAQAVVLNGPHCWLGGEPRTNPNWDTFTLEATGANSKYNALQLVLVKRLKQRFQFQSSFTWSKALVSPGEGSYNNQNVGKAAFAQDPGNPALDYGPSVFDVRTKWSLNAIYNLPNPVQHGGVVAGLLNGWWTSTIVNLQSGYPFSPGLNANRSRSLSGGSGTGGIDRPNLLPGYKYSDLTSGTVPTGCGSGAGAVPAGTHLGTVQRWFNPCAFGIQPAGFLGDAASDSLRGPGFATLDLSVVKNIRMGLLGEGGKLEFRAEGFNILNRANFHLPNRIVYTGLQNVESPLPTAGQITRTIGTSRQIQLALKIVF